VNRKTTERSRSWIEEETEKEKQKKGFDRESKETENRQTLTLEKRWRGLSGPRRRHLRRPLLLGQAPAAPNHRHMTACARDRASRLDSRARAMSSAAEPQDGGALTLGRARAPAWGPEAVLSLHSGVPSWPRPHFSGRRCSSRKKGRKERGSRVAGSCSGDRSSDALARGPAALPSPARPIAARVKKDKGKEQNGLGFWGARYGRRVLIRRRGWTAVGSNPTAKGDRR